MVELLEHVVVEVQRIQVVVEAMLNQHATTVRLESTTMRLEAAVSRHARNVHLESTTIRLEARHARPASLYTLDHVPQLLRNHIPIII